MKTKSNKVEGIVTCDSVDGGREDAKVGERDGGAESTRAGDASLLLRKGVGEVVARVAKKCGTC